MVRENCIAQPWIFVNQEVICDNARLHNNIKWDYGWCLSVIINESYQKMVWDPEMEVPRSTWNFRELIYTFKNCLNFSEKFFILPRIMREVFIHRQLSEGSRNCLRLPKTIWDYRQLSDNYKNYLRFPRTPNENTLEEKKEILVFRKIIALLLLNMTLYAQ